MRHIFAWRLQLLTPLMHQFLFDAPSNFKRTGEHIDSETLDSRFKQPAERELATRSDAVPDLTR